MKHCHLDETNFEEIFENSIGKISEIFSEDYSKLFGKVLLYFWEIVGIRRKEKLGKCLNMVPIVCGSF